MKKIIEGTGITKKKIKVFETWEEQRDQYREVAETFNEQKNWFERRIFMIGIETWIEHVTKNYVDTTEENDQGKMEYETIIEEDSELHFALQARSLIRIVRSAIGRNDMDEAVHFTWKLAEKLTEARFKFWWLVIVQLDKRIHNYYCFE